MQKPNTNGTSYLVAGGLSSADTKEARDFLWIDTGDRGKPRGL